MAKKTVKEEPGKRKRAPRGTFDRKAYMREYMRSYMRRYRSLKKPTES